MARILGIDYGKKRVGISISDETAKFAFPHRTLENKKGLIDELGKILKENQVFEIVIGDSLDLDNNPNDISSEIDVFIGEIGPLFNLPIHKEKEFFTTTEARRSVGSDNKVDAEAAALILQRFLDRRNKQQDDFDR